ncbi:MAG: PD-(D/E)XK nuclease family protein [Planctomycetes bacterium]|nr:PD-(D/E)XK nuclease family protein [Planctomycetota bacterium]
MNKPLRLSPTSGLNLYNDCKRCFWLHYNKGVQRPRGIFPSLPSGMDLIIKEYFDSFRGELPPELWGKVKGKLIPDHKLIEKWRNWRTGLEYKDDKINAVLFGALDDCIINGEKYAPIDYKTKGSAPKDGDSERYYQTQLDSYTLFLKAAGFEVDQVGYLIYYYPDKVANKGIIKFNIEPVKIGINPDRAQKLFEDAVASLKSQIPRPNPSCEYCNYATKYNSIKD